MCTGLLNNAFSVILRDWYDFAATISGPPRARATRCRRCRTRLVLFIGTMTDAVRNAVVEYGPENLHEGDILMVNDPYRIGTHVNDVLLHPAGVPRRQDRHLRQPAGAHARHGRRRAGRLRRHQEGRVRERPRDRAAAALPRRRAGQVGVAPDLRQRPLRRPAAAGHQDDLREPAPRRAPDAGDDRALRARRRARRDALRVRRVGRDDARGGHRAAARRRLRGRGHVRRRRHRRRRGRLHDQGQDHQARATASRST